MAKIVKAQEAKTRLAGLLAEVEDGEEIVIARGDDPIATLTPLQKTPQRELGFVPYQVPDSFFDPLPDGNIATHSTE